MQGFNMGRYIPPDVEGTISANQASGKGHSLGARASKLKSEGVLKVRFECPFAIWCTTCKPERIIGQGVRFNAEKKKVGNYYSTPIWAFRFKHTLCDGWLEVRTDPKKTEYVVIEGGKRRDTGEDKLLDGEIRLGLSEAEKDRLEKDGGFGTLERKVEDKRALANETERLEQLEKRSTKDWKDPYEQSKLLRRGFRAGRKLRMEADLRGEDLKERLSLGIDLLEERKDDAKRAKLIEYGSLSDETTDRQLFSIPGKSGSLPNGDKNETRNLVSSTAPERRRKRLGDEISGNTRKTMDPFLSLGLTWEPKSKRKKDDDKGNPIIATLGLSKPLVDYDSD